jgi:predicted O-methyltransferase YrrM
MSHLLDMVKVFSRHPNAVARYLLRRTFLLSEFPTIDWTLEQELAGSGLVQVLSDGLAAIRDRRTPSKLSQVDLYSVCRSVQPQTVVETGVHHGFSTALILGALRRNGHGRLISVDLPNIGSTKLPSAKEPGWLVPFELKEHWTLVIQDSKHVFSTLPEHEIDVFIHDSSHDYETMMFEFTQVWPRIKVGGFLMADDVMWNSAFLDFCSIHCLKPLWTPRGYGIVRKPLPQSKDAGW